MKEFTAKDAKELVKLSKLVSVTELKKTIKKEASKGESYINISTSKIQDRQAEELRKLGYKVVFIPDQRDGNYYEISWS